MPVWQHPRNAERGYAAALLAMLRLAREHAAKMMPGIVAAIEMSLLAHPRGDAEDNLPIKTLSDSIRAIFGVKQSRQVAESMANGVNTFNAKQFRKIVSSALGVDILVSEPWLTDVMASRVVANVGLIQSIPEKLLPEVEGLITNAMSGAIRVEELADAIFGRFDVAESRAKLIARDQVSKYNGSLTRLRQQNIGADEYIWRGALDERERETHVAHEGRRYRWDNPPADTGHPGDDYQCRCYGEMVVPDGLAATLDQGEE